MELFFSSAALQTLSGNHGSVDILLLGGSQSRNCTLLSTDERLWTFASPFAPSGQQTQLSRLQRPGAGPAVLQCDIVTVNVALGSCISGCNECTLVSALWLVYPVPRAAQTTAL